MIVLLVNGGDRGVTPVVASVFLCILVAPIVTAGIVGIVCLRRSVFLTSRTVDQIRGLADDRPLPVTRGPRGVATYSIAFRGISFTCPGTNRGTMSNVDFRLPRKGAFTLIKRSKKKGAAVTRLVPHF